MNIKKIITLKEILFLCLGVGIGLLALSITNYIIFNFINDRFDFLNYTLNETILYGVIISLPVIIFCAYKLKKLREVNQN